MGMNQQGRFFFDWPAWEKGRSCATIPVQKQIGESVRTVPSDSKPVIQKEKKHSDMPDSTITTAPYFSDVLVTVTLSGGPQSK